MNPLVLFKYRTTPIRKLLLLHMAAGGKLIEYTATGNPLTFVTDIAKELTQCLVAFSPVQSGTSDPSPENIRPITGWTGVNVTHCGKNLYEYNADNVKQETTSGGSTRAVYHTGVFGDGNYISLSAYKKDPEVTTSASINCGYFVDGTATVVEYFISSSRENARIAIASGRELVFIYTGDNVNGLKNDLKKYDIQIELSDTITEYSAYSGTTYPVTFPAVGKNLCGGIRFAEELKTRYESATIDKTNGTVSFAYNASTTQGVYFPKIEFKQNTQYTFILAMKNDSVARSNLQIAYTDGTFSNFPDLSGTGTKETIVITSSANKTVLTLNKRLQGGTTVLYYDECGVFKGTVSASAFEPFNNTVYGGTLDLTTGLLTVTAVVDDLGDLNWTYNGDYDYPYFSSSNLPSPNRIRALGVNSVLACEIYKPINNVLASTFRTSNYDHKICVNSGISAGYRLIVQDSSYTDADTFKTAVTGKKIVTRVNPDYYPTYQLTPQQITALIGQNVIFSDTNGDLTVKYLKKG